MRLSALFTGNPHFVNLFVLTTVGVGIPMAYMAAYGPSEDEKERRSIEHIPDHKAAAQRTAEFGRFLTVSDSKEMDDVYMDLLRSGASSPAKRRQAVYGKLGEAEKQQRDAALAKRYGLEALPAHAGAAASKADGENAPVTPTTPVPTV